MPNRRFKFWWPQPHPKEQVPINSRGRAQVHCDKNNRSTLLNARSFTRNISHRTIISAAHHHLQAIRMPTTAHIANGSAACISLLCIYILPQPLLLVSYKSFRLITKVYHSFAGAGWRHPLRLFFSITIRAWEDARLWILAAAWFYRRCLKQSHAAFPLKVAPRDLLSIVEF